MLKLSQVKLRYLYLIFRIPLSSSLLLQSYVFITSWLYLHCDGFAQSITRQRLGKQVPNTHAQQYSTSVFYVVDATQQ
jgi:hypothetical protein